MPERGAALLELSLLSRRERMFSIEGSHMKEDSLNLPNSRFSKWLRKEMAKSGMSPADLADEIGMGVSSVYSWLAGDSNPSPSSRKKIIAVFEGAIPEKILITTPLFGMTCKKCMMTEECMEGVVAGLPMMCESITMDDLLKAVICDYLDILIWWEDIDMDDYEDLDELAGYLNEER